VQTESAAPTLIIKRAQYQSLITGNSSDQFHATDPSWSSITLEDMQKRRTIGNIT
jgi:hypothetical protein